MSAPVTLVLSPADGSMESLASQLARRLQVERLTTDIYSRSAEQFNISASRAALAAAQDLAFIRRVRRLRGIIHFPNHHLARYGVFLRHPYIVTVHDLIRHFDCRGGPPLIHTPTTRDKTMLALDRAGIRRATAIIAVSQHTKQDVVRHLGVSPEKIRVIYPGVDRTRFRPIRERAVPYRYVLYVGSEHPRKNLPTLLAALRILKHDPAHRDLKLVKVGDAGGGEAPFATVTRLAIRRHQLRDDVIMRGRVPDEELIALYSAAECLVLPSLYEGFGLPPLEAMCCGCPVIVSDRGALPETAGPAALLTTPEPRALARSIRSLLSDRSLREQLVQAGHRHVENFSWNEAATETAAVYAQVASQRPVDAPTGCGPRDA